MRVRQPFDCSQPAMLQGAAAPAAIAQAASGKLYATSASTIPTAQAR